MLKNRTSKKARPMFKNGWGVVIILLVVLACVIFLPKKGEGPIIAGKTVTMDTVIFHDTIFVERGPGQIQVIKKIIHDTVAGIAAAGTVSADTVKCYSLDEQYPGGAYIKAEICSREFPELRPMDLQGNIAYLPPAESLKIETRVDTVPRIIYKPPIVPTWQAVTLGIAAGVLAGMLVKK
jgi:hypothetical protein